MTEITMPKVWRQIIESDKNYFLLPTGRVSGKTKNTVIFAILCMLSYPNYDIVVTRSSYGSMQDSSFAEFEAALNDLPEEIQSQFVFKKSPLRIERVNNSGTVYFIGAGGSNKDRTKGLKTSHPVKVVILEETQEFKDKESYDQFLASVRRNFTRDNPKLLCLGNPPSIAAHWFNLFAEQCKRDDDWLVVKMTWEDIVPFLNDFDIKEILKCKMLEPEYYNWLYGGIATGGFSTVYPMFRPKKHIISVLDLDRLFESTNIRIAAVVIGGDGAVTRDCSAFVPMALLTNGQCVVLPIFYHNPKDDAVIGYHQLVQNLLTRWFDDLCKRYHLGTTEEARQHPNMHPVPIYMRIDSAAPDLIQECRFFLGDRVDINPIQKKTVIEMVGVCQSAIANDNIYIVDYGGYFDYYKNQFIKKEVNVLAEQIESLVWNEKQNGYDPIVPNDVCDAWTYITYFWYSNQENIQYFNIVKSMGKNNMLISAILNEN